MLNILELVKITEAGTEKATDITQKKKLKSILRQISIGLVPLEKPARTADSCGRIF